MITLDEKKIPHPIVILVACGKHHIIYHVEVGRFISIETRFSPASSIEKGASSFIPNKSDEWWDIEKRMPHMLDQESCAKLFIEYAFRKHKVINYRNFDESSQHHWIRLWWNGHYVAGEENLADPSFDPRFVCLEVNSFGQRMYLLINTKTSEVQYLSGKKEDDVKAASVFHSYVVENDSPRWKTPGKPLQDVARRMLAESL